MKLFSIYIIKTSTSISRHYSYYTFLFLTGNKPNTEKYGYASFKRQTLKSNLPSTNPIS